MRFIFLFIFFALPLPLFADSSVIKQTAGSDGGEKNSEQLPEALEHSSFEDDLDFESLVIRDLNGKDLPFSNFKGKNLVLYFWSIYCGSCMDILKDVENEKERFVSKDLEFISIHLFEENTDLVKQALAKAGVPEKVYTVDKQIQDGLSVRIIPSLIAFNEKREILIRFDGIENKHTLESAVSNVIDAFAKSDSKSKAESSKIAN